jgi:hypothetical protein
METNDLLTIIILVTVAVVTGIMLSRISYKKKACTDKECDYKNKCDVYCPASQECPLSQSLEQFQSSQDTKNNTTDDSSSSQEVSDFTVIEPIDMSSDYMFEKPMYVSVMNTDIKSSCGSVDKTESRQQMLGAPFPTNYKSMMA